MLEELLSEWEKHKGLTKPPSKPVTLWAAPGRTIGFEKKWGPPIPYPDVDHGDGEINYGYVRVKGNLREISNIPEVQGWPELLTFLEIVNAPLSPIESVGCACGFFPDTDRAPATVRVGSYIDVIFTDDARNQRPEPVLLLAAHLMTAVEGCEQWWALVECGLQILHPASLVGRWGLVIRVINYGRSEEEARKWWGESLRRLEQAISDLPSDFGRQT